MRILNNYNTGYKDFNNNISNIKYGLLNDYGFNIDSSNQDVYDEDAIVKKLCNEKNKGIRKK